MKGRVLADNNTVRTNDVVADQSQRQACIPGSSVIEARKKLIGLDSSPRWCNVVKKTMSATVNRKKGDQKTSAQSPSAIRASISFPSNIYETLDIIAKDKKVSIAWVVREAAENYIAEKWPLLKGQV